MERSVPPASTGTVPLRSGWSSAGPLRVHGVTTGPADAAPGVVLVHGMVVAARGMQPLSVELWHRGTPSVAVELPGFGLSDKPARALDVEGLADALSLWAVSSGTVGATFVGNSFGTQVVTALAQRHPGTARAVVLVAPTVDPRFGRLVWQALPAGHGRFEALRLLRTAELRAMLQRELTPAPSSGPLPPLGALIRREYLAAGPLRALSTYRHALRDRPERRAATVPTPALVVRGAQDRLCGERWAQRLAGLFPHGRLATVPGAAHDMAFRQPAVLAEMLVAFLRELSSTAPAG